MKRKLAYTITGIFVLLIALVSGTYAYFAAKASSGDDTVSATATQLSLGYKDNKDNVRTDLIPTAESVAINYAEEGTCVDANEYSVCSMYKFTVENTSDVKVAIGAILKPNVNTFTNLKYRVYETEIVREENIISATKSLELNNGNDIYIEGIEKELAVGDKVTYTILMWVEETGEHQNLTDGGKEFAGKVEVYAYLPGTSSEDHNKPTGGDIVETEVPTNNSIIINNGDYQTSQGTVTASVQSTGATEVCLTETNDASSCTSGVTGTSTNKDKMVATPLVNKEEAQVTLVANNIWTSYSEELTYTLDTATEGEKTIYAFFKNEIGTSAGVSSTIIYSKDPYYEESEDTFYYEDGKYVIYKIAPDYIGYYDENLDRYYLHLDNNTSYNGFYENDGTGNKMYYNKEHNVYIDQNLELYRNSFNIDDDPEKPVYTYQTQKETENGSEPLYYAYSPQEGLYEFTLLAETNSEYNYNAAMISYSEDKQKMLYWGHKIFSFEKRNGYYYSSKLDAYFNEKLLYVKTGDENTYAVYEVFTSDEETDANLVKCYYDAKYKKYFGGTRYGVENKETGNYEFFQPLHDDYNSYVNDFENYKQIARTTSEVTLQDVITIYEYDETANMYYSRDLDEYYAYGVGIFENSQIIIEPEYVYFFTYDSESGMYVSDEGYYDESYNHIEKIIYYDAKGVISLGKFYYKDENGEYIEIT